MRSLVKWYLSELSRLPRQFVDGLTAWSDRVRVTPMIQRADLFGANPEALRRWGPILQASEGLSPDAAIMTALRDGLIGFETYGWDREQVLAFIETGDDFG